MGLAGARNKQRIGSDPQNKNWKNDVNNFGFRMLSKMGWADGKGLGVKEDGEVSHVKVRLKEDNLGLGADKRNVDNWLGNQNAFDDILSSLNSNAAADTTSIETTSETTVETARAPGRLYHRRKFVRNKLVSNYDAKDLQMIFGVKGDVIKEIGIGEKSDLEESNKENGTTMTEVSEMASFGLGFSGSNEPVSGMPKPVVFHTSSISAFVRSTTETTKDAEKEQVVTKTASITQIVDSTTEISSVGKKRKSRSADPTAVDRKIKKSKKEKKKEKKEKKEKKVKTKAGTSSDTPSSDKDLRKKNKKSKQVD
ncbi:hypothetical protein DFS34DRAFT_688207 [Phlyctochytrium arcticum]|nr:hypothetical protein DFS34DRAFT_688207 [Phlyctochytrium arcticum]